MDPNASVAHSGSVKEKHDTSGRLEPVSEKSVGLRLITALHRGGDSYVTFGRKVSAEGKFQNLFSIRANHLQAELPRHLDRLRRDSYFSVNGFWNRTLNSTREVPFIPGFIPHRTAQLQYLNAVYSDIDFYKKGLSTQAVRAEIEKLVERGTLPPPSFGLQSRGLWLFWLLHDGQQTGKPPPSSKGNRAAFRRIMKKICAVLEAVGADPGAIDPARITRVPGSVNSKNNQHVQVLWPPPGRKPAIYTLNRLVEFFKLDEEDESAKRIATDLRRIKTALRHRGILQPRPLKKSGWMGVNDQRLRQFIALWELRGGFKEGCRTYAALIYARLLSTLGVPDKAVVGLLEEFGNSCKPPLLPHEIAGAVSQGMKQLPGSIRNETISEWLAITYQEHVALRKIFSRYAWKAFEQAPQSRAQKRRKEIQRIVRKQGLLPNRRMAELLTKRGHPASPTQVLKDYKSLELKDARPEQR